MDFIYREGECVRVASFAISLAVPLRSASITPCPKNGEGQKIPKTCASLPGGNKAFDGDSQIGQRLHALGLYQRLSEKRATIIF